MSTNTAPQKPTGNREIPTRRVPIHDASQMPGDYSTTPGGTMFSTTPGGTRIIYDRHFLMNLRESPLARTPPKNLPNIPGVTNVGESGVVNGTVSPLAKERINESDKEVLEAEEQQFEMDI